MLYCQKTSLPLARSKPRIDDRLAQKAAKTWSTWTKSDVQWKRKIVGWANVAMERISYEEWSLKTIPAKHAHLRRTAEEKQHVSVEEIERHSLNTENITVEYPGTMMTTAQAMDRLRGLSQKGQSYHNRYFWLSAIGAPLTLPMAALPVIPNLPGFYLLFRAWSHWKALEGAKHLSYLVADNHLSLQDNARLNRLYLEHEQNKGTATLKDNEIEELSEELGASEMSSELHRALKQVQKPK